MRVIGGKFCFQQIHTKDNILEKFLRVFVIIICDVLDFAYMWCSQKGERK